MKETKNVLSKSLPLKLLISVIVLALLAFYFKIFFTTGRHFRDTFIKKETSSSETQYVGKNKYGNIKITVKELSPYPKTVTVVYELPNNIKKEHTVTFKKDGNNDSSLLAFENIKDETGNIVFAGGYYDKDAGLLLDEKQYPVFEENLTVVVEGQNPFVADHKISPSTTLDFASSTADIHRGQYQLLIAALIILAITLIDIKFPLFFFTFRHIGTVDNPQPSELYIILQKISWFLGPAISIILMIVAII